MRWNSVVLLLAMSSEALEALEALPSTFQGQTYKFGTQMILVARVVIFKTAIQQINK